MYLYEVGLGATVAVTLYLALTAFLLLVHSLSPGFVAQARDRFKRSPVTSVLLGIPIAVALLLATILSLKAPAAPIRMLGFVCTGLSIGLAFAGATGFIATVAESLGLGRDGRRAWPAFLRASLVVLLSAMVPFLGWFVVFPVLVLGGLGTAARVLLSPSEKTALALGRS